MAFDSFRGVTVLFGGRQGGDDPQDTWEWDGTSWALQANDGPAARGYHEMGFDSARGVCVLFGGVGAGGAYGDTWEWDGKDWSLRSTVGPPPRHRFAMASDTTRGVTVVFGGSDRNWNTLGDTWEWDGTDWTLVSSEGPARRNDLAMVYDGARREIVLFGGFFSGSRGLSNETWVYAPPCSRYEHIKPKVRKRGTACVLVAAVRTGLSVGAEVTLCFEGDEACGCQTATVNEQGRARARCRTEVTGTHTICIPECEELCEKADCIE